MCVTKYNLTRGLRQGRDIKIVAVRLVLIWRQDVLGVMIAFPCQIITGAFHGNEVWSGSIVAQVMVCYLTAPSHHLNHCWHIIIGVRKRWPARNFAVLQWRHNGRDGFLNHRRRDCLLNRLFRCRSKNISKLIVTGLCEGNPWVTGEFPAQRSSNAENVSIWWRHHGE